MSKRNTKAIKKNNNKKPVIVEPEIKPQNDNPAIDSDEEVEDKVEDEEQLNDLEEQEEDDLGDDKNEIDDEDKDINDDGADDYEEEKEEGEDKKKPELEEDKCMYNFVDNNSDEEVELVFDDDAQQEVSDIVPKNQRRTKPILFKYERVRILGDRTQQLTLGAKPMIKNTTGMDPKSIALEEINQSVIPLKIGRPLPNGKKEIWYIHELTH
jgi:DNA-directed RNA polymerase subunit K/omega